IGGPFFTKKCYASVEGKATNISRASGNSWFHYDGVLMPYDVRNLSYPASQESDDITLSRYGATAVARCSPTNPVANLTTFLGETLKDGLPSIPGIKGWERRAQILASAGEEFLNVVFGWDPLISDIKSTAKAIAHAKAVMKQFERDAGKVVRRSYYFDTESSSTTSQFASNVGPYYGHLPDMSQCNLSYLFDETGNVFKTSKVVKKRWFSGAFTYHIPGGVSNSAMDRSVLELKRVFGLNLTPETLWNLTPWSWALDWVTNAGDVLANLSAQAQFGQVLRYGYVMEHIKCTDTYYFSSTAPSSFGDRSSVATLSLITETKKRVGANPFGFGLTWDGLSATQKAIAAAIGLTIGRN
ncbi:maturation protein, partial [ssRNA phage Zoerhiza.2_12]